MNIHNNSSNHEQLRKILLNLPESCYDYFISISANTSILTRINYATDIQTFFQFLIKQEMFLNITKTETFTIDDIKKITLKDIELYQNYLIIYDKVYYKKSSEKASKNLENDEIKPITKTFTNSSNGIKRKLCSIRSFFKYLIKHNEIEINPTELAEIPKIKEKPIVKLDSDEVSALIDIVKSGEGLTARQKSYHRKTVLRDTCIILLLLGTGIRLSECIGVNLDDVYFKDNAIKVTRKGGNESILYYNDDVKDVMLDYYNARKSNEKAEKSEKALFLSLQNRRISNRSVENLVKKYTKLITPLKNISPHKLRSTYGTNLYNNSGDIYLVAEVLGHKDVNTTKKHYANISDDRKKTAPSFIDF